VSGKHSVCLNFAGKAGTYPSAAQFRYSNIGGLLALAANIRLRSKGLTVTNTLTYYEQS
jgi:hypothetical protein